MLSILIVCVLIFLLLLVAEYLKKNKKISSEVARKIVHMGSGAMVAFLPYFTTYRYIQILCIAFLLVIVVSARLKIFKSIHSVKRVTKGELLYPIGLGVCAFLEPASWIFVAAVLHLAIADALAAIVGVKWGKRTRYTLMSHGKSFLGSMVFFYVSMAILFSATLFVHSENLPASYVLLVVVPGVLTLLENISWYGSDNITVPVMAIVLLSSLSL